MKTKVEYVDPPKGRKTIEFSELKLLSTINSEKLPQAVDVAGVRREWVGIGWVEVGKPEGDEVIVVEDGMMPVLVPLVTRAEKQKKARKECVRCRTTR